MSLCSIKEGRGILDFHNFFMVGCDFLLTSQFCLLSSAELLSLKQERANSSQKGTVLHAREAQHSRTTDIPKAFPSKRGRNLNAYL